MILQMQKKCKYKLYKNIKISTKVHILKIKIHFIVRNTKFITLKTFSLIIKIIIKFKKPPLTKWWFFKYSLIFL